jgi:hypothetical protein
MVFENKEDETGRACSMHGRGKRMHIEFWYESQKERSH